MKVKVGDRVRIRYLNAEFTGTVMRLRLVDEDDVPLAYVQIDSQRASIVPLRQENILAILPA